MRWKILKNKIGIWYKQDENQILIRQKNFCLLMFEDLDGLLTLGD